jgi:hypothetical protein
MSRAEIIAARLSPAQKRAMPWFAPERWERRPGIGGPSRATLRALKERGLCAPGVMYLGWAITPLGEDVRALLAKAPTP